MYKFMNTVYCFNTEDLNTLNKHFYKDFDNKHFYKEFGKEY